MGFQLVGFKILQFFMIILQNKGKKPRLRKQFSLQIKSIMIEFVDKTVVKSSIKIILIIFQTCTNKPLYYPKFLS